ncbi:uncharacterized protein LOC101170740 [Oryzias latipes]|uniref:uncharacterized protein LOC101170740 n=1 Tax=Oryzias latipes TaxID=8090 RepID=UPI000CE17ADB|nr:uncharacterized protein LOC101170740 [Oryzias latipes]
MNHEDVCIIVVWMQLSSSMFAAVVYLSVLTHSALSVSILQSVDLLSPPGASVALECQMGPGLSMSSFTILWYRQNRPGAPIQLLLTEYEQTKDHFRASIDGPKNNFTLQIHDLSEDDSSIYFCAARHSDAVTAYSHTNNTTAPQAAVGAVVYFCHGVEIQQPSSVFGRDGDPSVTLTCKQDDSQFFYMFWYRQQGGGRMELLVYSPGALSANVEAPFNGSKYSASRPTVLASSLQVQAVEAADAAVYFCASKKAKKGGNDEDLPPHPNPPHPLELQRESEQQDWGQFGDFLLQDTSSVTLEVKLSLEKEPNSAFWGTNRNSLVGFCKRDLAVCSGSYQAYFGEGTRLTVLEAGINVTAPTRVKVLSPSEKECSSGKKTLVCVASGFYPDHVSVSWMINEKTVSKGVATDSAATRYGTSYRITSRLTVSSEEWTSDNKFVCSVSFFNGTTTTYHNDSITGEAKKSPSGTELSRDKYLRVTQSAKLSYIIFIVKSCIYGAFIWFVAWKLQSSREKRRK